MSTIPVEAPRVCALCLKETEPRELSRCRDEKTGEYVLYECKDCGVHFWLPMRNPGSAWYECDKRYADRNLDPILTPNEKHEFVYSFFHNKKPRVLDVGCGVGNFIGPAQKRYGWECVGIDFDQDAIEAARRTFNLKNVFTQDIAHFANSRPEERFDLITFFDVFEHIDNHHEFIKCISKLLDTHGHIALSMPYRHGWRWFMPNDFPPRHLTRWDAPSLSVFLLRNGYTITALQRVPVSIYFIAMKLRYRYGSFLGFGLVRKKQLKDRASQKSGQEIMVSSASIRLLKKAAKFKDLLLFGVPAIMIWLFILPTQLRYTDMVIIAKKN